MSRRWIRFEMFFAILITIRFKNLCWLPVDILDQRTIENKGVELWGRNIHPKNPGRIKKGKIKTTFLRKFFTIIVRCHRARSRQWRRTLRWYDCRSFFFFYIWVSYLNSTSCWRWLFCLKILSLTPSPFVTTSFQRENKVRGAEVQSLKAQVFLTRPNMTTALHITFFNWN